MNITQSTLLTALLISSFSTNLIANEIEPLNNQYKEFSQTLNESQFENLKTNNFLFDIKKESVKEFNVLNGKSAELNDIVFTSFENGITGSFVPLNTITLEKLQEEDFLKERSEGQSFTDWLQTKPDSYFERLTLKEGGTVISFSDYAKKKPKVKKINLADHFKLNQTVADLSDADVELVNRLLKMSLGKED